MNDTHDINKAPSFNKPIATLVPTKSDADYAQEIKERFVTVTVELVELLNEVKKNGFDLQFQFGPNPMGKVSLNALQVIKVY